MPTRRGLAVSGLVAALLLLGTSAVDSAAAAGGPPPAAKGPVEAKGPAELGHEHAGAQLDDHDRAEHMAEDLVGTPISVIEQRTTANAARIQKATGVRPGTSRAQAAAVAADPGVAGSWSPIVDTPLVPVFAAILPNGKSLMWDSV